MSFSFFALDYFINCFYLRDLSRWSRWKKITSEQISPLFHIDCKEISLKEHTVKSSSYRRQHSNIKPLIKHLPIKRIPIRIEFINEFFLFCPRLFLVLFLLKRSLPLVEMEKTTREQISPFFHIDCKEISLKEHTAKSNINEGYSVR